VCVSVFFRSTFSLSGGARSCEGEGTAVNFTAHERRLIIAELGLDHGAIDFVVQTLERVTIQARNDGRARCFACVEDVTFVREQDFAELRLFVGVCGASVFSSPRGTRLNRVRLKLRLPPCLLLIWRDCVSARNLPGLFSVGLESPAPRGSLACIVVRFGRSLSQGSSSESSQGDSSSPSSSPGSSPSRSSSVASALFDVLQPVEEPLDDLRRDPDFTSRAVVGRVSPVSTRSAAAADDGKEQGKPPKPVSDAKAKVEVAVPSGDLSLLAGLGEDCVLPMLAPPPLPPLFEIPSLDLVSDYPELKLDPAEIFEDWPEFDWLCQN